MEDKYHLFRSKNNPTLSISIGERPDGTYFIPAVVNEMEEEDNTFDTIEEIEKVLNDQLELLRPKSELN